MKTVISRLKGTRDALAIRATQKGEHLPTLYQIPERGSLMAYYRLTFDIIRLWFL